jgi:hypothetical protein
MADGAKAASAQVAHEVEGVASDRRDSARIVVSLLVRDAALGGSFEEHAGNVSIGGVWFDALHPPAGRRFDVRFLLPGLREELRAVAEVLRVTEEGGRFGTHLKFVDIPLEAEMALARFLQEA